MTIREGSTKSFMGYDITYTGTERLDEPHRWSRVARFDIAKDGEGVGQAEPRLNHYKKMNQAIGTPTVMSGLDEDLYLSLRDGSINEGVVDIAALTEGRPQPHQGEGYTLHRIGDAVASRTIAAAIYDARRLCQTM